MAPERPGRPRTRQRGFVEVRWRQFRNAPRPIVRAVVSSLVIATVLGLAYLAYDVALDRGAQLPGGDLRSLFVAIFVVIVLAGGAVVTYVLVPQPAGADRSGRPRRTAWSAALGFFAAVPIAYLVMVAVTQLLKPLLV